ncbi:hypothetical protein QQS21_000255 [Conoideocrella luteorostrata]|uniref:Uncharacterized protein n=1 Tax=Conoideocrella luteorostrata TaxID=1105319 RepID=A0AAJ0CZF4_9HYPO|nr:hypothetical protein QQS21_000255 [Conoideocrella luteorostrata]
MEPVQRKPLGYTKIPSPQNQDEPAYPQLKTVRWALSWRPAATMFGLLGLGISSALGHHFFNKSLDSKPTRTAEIYGPSWGNQQRIGRYGLALAFLTKTLLAGAVAFAYKQHIWTNFRQRPYSLCGLNSMYDATSNIFAFASGEFLGKATVASLLAALVWTIPLSALITPSSLVMVLSTQNISTTMSVPTLNFNDTSLYYFAGMVGDVAPLLTRTTSSAASSARILPMVAVAFNASYNLRFDGPSLKCDTANGSTLEVIDRVFNMTKKAMGGDGGQAAYLAFTPAPTLFGSSNANLSDDIYSKFVADCVMGESDCTLLPNDDPTTMLPILARANEERLCCSLQNTSYSVTFRSTGQSQNLIQYAFHWKGMTSNFAFLKASQAIANLLNGMIGGRANNPNMANSGPELHLRTMRTRIMDTALIGIVNTSQAGTPQLQRELPPVPSQDQALSRNMSLGKLIEELSRNQTLSLFSDSRFWSQDGARVAVDQSLTITRWHYQSRNLWLAYGLAISAATVGALLGLRALHLNGVAYDTSFSTTLLTTRNITLDQLALGSSLGAQPVNEDVLKTKLMFGVLKKSPQESSPCVAHAAFGLEAEVSRIQKGQLLE